MADIIQKQDNKKDSTSTQIGTQNNYYGLTPEAAAEISIKLFYDNFPKLQEEAKKIIDQRMTEFNGSLFIKLRDKGFDNFNIFSNPDMQYDLYEAQKAYAKSGDPDLLSMLTTTMEERCKAQDSTLFKISISESINILPKLLPRHLKMLSLVFLLRETVNHEVKDMDTLREYIIDLVKMFDTLEFNQNDILHLIQLGIAQDNMHLDDLGEMLSKRYKDVFTFVIEVEKGIKKLKFGSEYIKVENRNKESVDIKMFLISEIPEITFLFDFLSNYKMRSTGLTNVGKLIAIKALEINNNIKMDSEMWIE